MEHPRCTELLQDCYPGEEETIAAATRKMIYHLFAKDGLVVVDGDDEELKRLFIPIMEQDILGAVFLSCRIKKQ
jgi:uncharacterized protein YllA (UPF0747 family)